MMAIYAILGRQGSLRILCEMQSRDVESVKFAILSGISVLLGSGWRGEGFGGDTDVRGHAMGQLGIDRVGEHILMRKGENGSLVSGSELWVRTFISKWIDLKGDKANHKTPGSIQVGLVFHVAQVGNQLRESLAPIVVLTRLLGKI